LPTSASLKAIFIRYETVSELVEFSRTADDGFRSGVPVMCPGRVTPPTLCLLRASPDVTVRLEAPGLRAIGHQLELRCQ
jgi:hypothetical protein